jgi:hypothetical protein
MLAGRQEEKGPMDTNSGKGLKDFSLKQYNDISSYRQHNELCYDPDRELLLKFLAQQKNLRHHMAATGVRITNDLAQVMFLMPAMPKKYATSL